MGLVWPPKPFCFASYRRFPWADKLSLPFLCWDTFCWVCFLQRLQKVLRDLGMDTIG